MRLTAAETLDTAAVVYSSTVGQHPAFAATGDLWKRLDKAAVLTAVSRYMRYRMWELRVDPLVVPNGLSEDALPLPERDDITAFERRFRDRTVLGKVARWDPDKRWLLAVETVAELRRQKKRPLLIARGGVEAHQSEVLAAAAAAGLRVEERVSGGDGLRGFLGSLAGLDNIDVVNLRFPLDSVTRRVLFRGCDAILANSGHEPFGLVGLETMGVGGLACTGGTGEDYAVPGWNSLVLQTTDPREFIDQFDRLTSNPNELGAVRRRGRSTAKQHTWKSIIERSLLPRLVNSGNGRFVDYPPDMGHVHRRSEILGFRI